MSAMDVLSEVMFAKDLAPPCRGRPKRCLKFGFHFYYINNPGKPEFWHRRFASTERPETVPTSSSRPSVMKSKSLNYYAFAQITVPTAVPACTFSLGGDANSVFLLNCDFERNPRSLFMVFFIHFIWTATRQLESNGRVVARSSSSPILSLSS